MYVMYDPAEQLNKVNNEERATSKHHDIIILIISVVTFLHEDDGI